MDRPKRLTGQACLQAIHNLACDDSGDSSDEQEVVQNSSDVEYDVDEIQSNYESDDMSDEEEPLPGLHLCLSKNHLFIVCIICA